MRELEHYGASENILRTKLTLFILLIYYFAINASAENVHPPKITVALILPLSGEWAFLGNGIKNGAILAKDDLDKNNFPIELKFEDNRGELAASVTSANNLIANNKIDALISIISGVAKVLKPIAIRNQIINIGICSDSDIADGDYNFINYLTAEQAVEKYLEYFRLNVGQRQSLGVYSMNESGFIKISETLSRMADGNPKVVFTEYFNRGTSDFKPALLRNKKLLADNFLILGLSPEIEILAKQIRSLGMNNPLTSIEGFGLSKDHEAFNDSWFVDSAVPNSQFQTRYRKKFNAELTPGVGHSYDSIMLLAAAFDDRQSQTDTKNSVSLTKLKSLKNFSGVTGNLSVRGDGIIMGSASIKKILNGQVVVVAP